jgi:hypothetical protein
MVIVFPDRCTSRLGHAVWAYDPTLDCIIWSVEASMHCFTPSIPASGRAGCCCRCPLDHTVRPRCMVADRENDQGRCSVFARRVLAEPVGRAQGETVLIQNRPGAGGATGAEAVSRAAPDGNKGTPWRCRPTLAPSDTDLPSCSACLPREGLR